MFLNRRPPDCCRKPFLRHRSSSTYVVSMMDPWRTLLLNRRQPPDMLPPASSRSCVSLINVGSSLAIPVKAPPLSVLALDGMSVPE